MYDDETDLINHMNATNGRIFGIATFSILGLLSISLITLIILICKHFGKLLLYEMAWLCTVQVLFQLGFLARGLGVTISNKRFIENGAMWSYRMCLVSSFFPFITISKS